MRYFDRMAKLTEAAIATLSTEERLSLIGALWDSLSDADAALPDSQREELDRRLRLFEQEKGAAATWDSIKAELRARA